MDVLSDVLRIVRLTGAIFFTADLSAPYSIASPPSYRMLRHMKKDGGCLSLFHILTEGSCWFKIQNNVSFQLTEGDVIIFPQGCSHVMCSSTNLQSKELLKLISFEALTNRKKVAYGAMGD